MRYETGNLEEERGECKDSRHKACDEGRANGDGTIAVTRGARGARGGVPVGVGEPQKMKV